MNQKLKRNSRFLKFSSSVRSIMARRAAQEPTAGELALTSRDIDTKSLEPIIYKKVPRNVVLDYSRYE